MSPKSKRTVFLIHWLVFLAFLFSWALALFELSYYEIVKLLTFGYAHKGFGPILAPMVMYVFPFAFLAGDWIATGKLTMWPWERKLPPKK